MEVKTYEQFPGGIILLANLLSLTIYALGILIISQTGVWFVLIYVLYCLWMEFRLMRKGCVNCYYYGKRCGLGRGVICSWLFKQGNNEKFNAGSFTWINLLPDLMVTIIPLILGIISLIKNFSWILLLALIVLIILSTSGNAIIRGNFLCRYCRQRESGCLAEQLFSSSRQQKIL
jgi:hypothetical protein